MIFGFTFTLKKGKREFCYKKTIRFTLILVKGTKGWRRKKAKKERDGSLLFITY
jgi:hypothetical protein